MTGESIPILKQEIQFGQFLDKLDHQLHKTSILLCGSHVLDRVSNNDIIGIVIATGFNSKKGEIINSTLYPHNLNIQFHSDSYKFIGLLSIVALSAFINNLVIGVSKHSSFWQILATSFDLISIAVPPALPLLLTASIGISISRLKKSLILSTNPERILTAGSVDLICWDKTGTLTNPDLEYIGVDEFIGLVYTPSKIVETGLAICHEIDGNLQGRSIDLVLIKSTNWKIENYIENILIDGSSVETIVKITSPLNEVYTVIKRFEFNADIKRMSVLSYNVNSGLVLYAKGSPESIKSICEMKSIPKDFQKILKNYSNQGYYVLAIAYKPIKIDCSLIPETSRRQWESKLTFLGFIVLNSPIKSEASTIISELSAAKIRSVIITGDTHLTSIHCARQIGLCNEIAMIDIEENQLVFYYVAGSNRNSLEKHDFKSMDAINNIEKGHPDHRFEFEELTKHVNMSRTPLDLAVSGNALDMIQELYGDAFTSWLLSRTRIFTRTRPLQKTQIVEKLIFENWIVAYCGDGTNDVGALKASHIGLALDSTDASIVAPFTSGSKSISDLPMILCEGRCALETSFVAFKYMTLYPIIQLFLEASLYSMQTTLSNNQLLFDDLFLVLCTSILMCYAAPLTKIPTERSSTSLFAPHILATIVGQFLISISFFYIQFALLTSQIWFCSTSKATSGLDKSKWLPLNSTAPLNISYPCYHISRQDITGSGMLLGSQESTALWLYTHVQFLWVALALSALGKQRQPFYRNFIFVAYLIFAFIICFWLFLIDQEVGAFANTIKNWLNLREDDSIPLSYRFGLAFLTLLNGIISVLYEVFIVDKFVIPWTISRDEKQRIKRAQTRAKLAGVIGMNSGSKGRGNGMIKSSSVPNFSFADV